MSFSKQGIAALVCLFFILLGPCAVACSMYKFTADGKTIVGCNEDAWRTTSRIWFKNGDETNRYGAAFTGSRIVADDRCAPQSGMNEVGLAFSRLVAYHPTEEVDVSDKIAIAQEVDYLEGILQNCHSVADVKAYIKRYDHSIFIDDVFIYVDSSGDYLVVEPYDLIRGSDPSYVLSNFCPSITTNDASRNLERYRNGEDFIKLHTPEATLAYATALSDTMHVCRSRNGDGTLLTSIWDSKDGNVNLYFYHDYSHTLAFNLKDELTKGDHLITLPEVFPANAEFQRLAAYKTPFNTPLIRFALAAIGGFLLLLSLALIAGVFIRKMSGEHRRLQLLFSVLNLFVFGFLFVLATEINIFYFDAPYEHYSSEWITASAYVPFLLLIALFPLVYYSIKCLRDSNISGWSKGFLFSNTLTYAFLLVAFYYWGLFDVFG